MKEQLNELKPFECTVCGVRLKCPKSFKKHKLKHFEPQVKLRCPMCPNELTDKYKLQSHIKNVHENRKDFHCDVCGKRLKGALNLRLHKTTAHSDLRPFQCPRCSASFKTTQILKKHIQRIHNDLPAVQCEICEKWLKNVLNLKEHKKMHENVTFNCTKCEGFAFTTKRSLADHISQVHFTYACVICNLQKAKRFKVVKHIHELHEDVINENTKPETFVKRVQKN